MRRGMRVHHAPADAAMREQHATIDGGGAIEPPRRAPCC
jgi:hypothetical protein